VRSIALKRSIDELLSELLSTNPAELHLLLRELAGISHADHLLRLTQRDGASRLVQELPQWYWQECIGRNTKAQRAWELTGLFYLQQGRCHEALAVFASLYDFMLAAQVLSSTRFHKGMPLCWISDCYAGMGYASLAKRYLMLTLCEDAMSEGGTVSPGTTGVYFRLVLGGLPDSELKRYATAMYDLYAGKPDEGVFPEWVLAGLDQHWMTAVPAPEEATAYVANTRYLRHLMSGLGEPTGKTLERLAEYVLSCMPGCRTTRRRRSGSSDYDIVCAIDGFDLDFRSELGRYFLCECKDWKNAADFTTMAKLCRVLDSVKSRFGILFSKNGISGKGKTANAEREQLKVFQDRGMVIVVVDLKDLVDVAEGRNFINLLRDKYERTRLDLRETGD
jgi:hypothetical protein